MSLRINSISRFNQVRNQNNEKCNNPINTPITEPQCDTVCFKGVGKLKQISLIARVAKILMGGGGLIALAEFMSSLKKEEAEFVDEYLSSQFGEEEDEEETVNLPTIEEGRADFKEMMQSQWIYKYKSIPELFEKLLLEEDEYKGEKAKRLFFVQKLDVIRAFYKDNEAMERIYSRDNILELERRSDGWNSPIEDMQIDCKDFIDKKMFETDDEGKILLHIFAKEYKSEDKFASPFLHVNKAYKKRPEKLAEMYLTKDLNGKYPLDYIKVKPIEEQQEALKTVKTYLSQKPELYEKVLANYDLDYLAEEQELQEKVKQLMRNGWKYTDEEGNRVVAEVNKTTAERLIKGEIEKPDGCRYKKFNKKDQLIEDESGDNSYSSRTRYFYDDNGVCVKKIHSVSSKYNSSTETRTLVDGVWKSDKEGGWKDW